MSSNKPGDSLHQVIQEELGRLVLHAVDAGKAEGVGDSRAERLFFRC